ncbi:MAG: hypothetical protein ACR2MF_03365 [Chthoniobacterales bacterium]
MSLAEIEAAVKELTPEELTKLAGFIAHKDKLGWDAEIEADFSPEGKHAVALKNIDAQIDAGKFTPLP